MAKENTEYDVSLSHRHSVLCGQERYVNRWLIDKMLVDCFEVYVAQFFGFEGKVKLMRCSKNGFLWLLFTSALNQKKGMDGGRQEERRYRVW